MACQEQNEAQVTEGDEQKGNHHYLGMRVPCLLVMRVKVGDDVKQEDEGEHMEEEQGGASNDGSEHCSDDQQGQDAHILDLQC